MPKGAALEGETAMHAYVAADLGKRRHISRSSAGTSLTYKEKRRRHIHSQVDRNSRLTAVHADGTHAVYRTDLGGEDDAAAVQGQLQDFYFSCVLALSRSSPSVCHMSYIYRVWTHKSIKILV